MKLISRIVVFSFFVLILRGDDIILALHCIFQYHQGILIPCLTLCEHRQSIGHGQYQDGDNMHGEIENLGHSAMLN
jgi:hypothetical protein